MDDSVPDNIVEELAKELGQNWSDPDFLKVCPFFLAKRRNNGRNGRGDTAERCLLYAASRLKETKNCPCGYFIMNTNVRDFHQKKDLETDGIFVHKNCVTIFEVKDKDNMDDAVNEAIPQLRARIKAINDITNGKIPVRGAIVLPFNSHARYCERSSEFPFSILHQGDLCPERFSSWINSATSSPNSNTATSNQRIALAKVLFHVYLKRFYPETEEEAIEFEYARITLQRHNEYQCLLSPTFNFIKFTNYQQNQAKTMMVSNTLLCGGYGTGKTITIVLGIQKVIKRFIKRNKRVKILFVSAQSFINNKQKLHNSPFLENVRKWIREALPAEDGLLEIKYYQNGADLRKESSAVVELCLLTEAILSDWSLNSSSFEEYNLIVLEESMALSVEDMAIFTKCVQEAKQESPGNNVLFWVTSTSSSTEFKGKYPGFEKFKDLPAECNCLRSTLEISTLCNSFQADFIPERFESLRSPPIKMWEGIPVTYHCYRDDAERFNIVKDTIKQWVDPPSRRVQILIIDCEDNNQLFKHLKSENVPICEYKDSCNIPLLSR